MLLKRDIQLMLLGVFLSPIVGSLLAQYTLPVAWLETNMSYKLLLKISLSLLIGLCLISAYLYYLKKQNSNITKDNKINIDDYEQPIGFGGLSKHKKTASLYCTSCLINNIKSPVNPDEYGWRCLLKSCNKYFRNKKGEELMEEISQ